MISESNISKIIILVCVLLCFTNCQNNEQQTKISVSNTTEIDSTKITINDISELQITEYAMSQMTKEKTSNWQAYNELSNKIEILRTGDLSFFRDDQAILKGFLTDLKNEVPESVESQAILVRLKVIETLFLKLEGLASINVAKKKDLLNNIKEILLCYSNLIFQMNKKFEKESQNIEKPI